MKVTAVLITWKRQQNIPKIVENILQYQFIDEILIRDNSKGDNLKTWARYELAKQAKNDIIYTQDDDCVIPIDKIFNKFDGNVITYGGTPESVNNSYHKRLCLMGWGSFFKKEWLNVFDKYESKYGRDYLFYREADRIFTTLQPTLHKPVIVEIEHLDAIGGVAMSAEQEHVSTRNEAVNRCLNL